MKKILISIGKRYRNALLVIAVLAVILPVGICGSPVFAGMKAPRPTWTLLVVDYITYMKSDAKKNKLSESDKELLYVAEFAFETVGLRQISVPGRSSGPMEKAVKQLRLADVVKAFEQKISWDTKLARASLQKISKDRFQLKKLFQSSEYSWAWVLKQLGEVKKSHSILDALFKKEYVRVMELENASSWGGRPPLGNSEEILRALNSMSDEKKQSNFNEKMRKMKTHLSKLPYSQINT